MCIIYIYILYFSKDWCEEISQGQSEDILVSSPNADRCLLAVSGWSSIMSINQHHGWPLSILFAMISHFEPRFNRLNAGDDLPSFLALWTGCGWGWLTDGWVMVNCWVILVEWNDAWILNDGWTSQLLSGSPQLLLDAHPPAAQCCCCTAARLLLLKGTVLEVCWFQKHMIPIWYPYDIHMISTWYKLKKECYQLLLTPNNQMTCHCSRRDISRICWTWGCSHFAVQLLVLPSGIIGSSRCVECWFRWGQHKPPSNKATNQPINQPNKQHFIFDAL